MSELKSLRQLYKKFGVILTRQQKAWAGVLFVMTVFGALFEALGVSAVMPLISVMIEPDTIRNSRAGEKVLAVLPEMSNEELMLLTAVGVIAVYIVKNAYMAGLCYVRTKYSCKVQRELSVRIMHSYIRRGYPYFLSNTVGDILRGCAGSVSGVYMILGQLFRILAEILTITCICGYLIIEDAVLAGTIIVLALLCVVLTVLIFRRKVKYYGEEQFKYNSIVSRNSLQLFYGIKEVLVMKRTRHFLNEYEDAYIHKQKATISQTLAVYPGRR